MKTVTITSSQTSATLSPTAQEFQSIDKLSSSAPISKLHAMIDVVVGANVYTVTLTTRPVAMAKASMTQRLNQLLELGYTPPIQSTSSK